MNELEQLNERIAQLTELIKNGSEAIKSMQVALQAAEEERDRLAVQQKEIEPKFERVKKNENYYYLEFGSALETVTIYSDADTGHPIDKNRFDNNNYFHTEQRAQEVADKINFLLKLERLHDTFCPDFFPNWKNNDEIKYSVFYDNYSRCYRTSMFSVNEYKNNAFFATKEIAQKVCDILNAELREREEL